MNRNEIKLTNIPVYADNDGFLREDLRILMLKDDCGRTLSHYLIGNLESHVQSPVKR